MVAQRDRAVRRWTTRGGVLAAVAAVGIAAGSGSAAAETFRWAFQGDIQTLDPHGLFETFTLGFQARSEEHTSELQSLMRISYAVFCLKKKTNINKYPHKPPIYKNTAQ